MYETTNLPIKIFKKITNFDPSQKPKIQKIMCENQKPVRPGATLADHQAHEKDHKLWSRRDFLSATGLFGAGSFALGSLGVRTFLPSPLLASLAGAENDRVLVLIRLDGGNDGLNTVVQRGNSDYYKLRPSIGIQENQMWFLNQNYGMPLATQPLQSLWQEGMMKTILNVGYPEPNYSHFRSYDIVATGSPADQLWHTGWMGRFLDNQFSAFLATPPTVPPALQIGVQSNLVFQADAANMALAVSSPQEFYEIAQSGQLYPTAGLGSSPREQELLYVRQTANSAFRYATTIKNAYSKGKNQVTYPQNNDLAEQMAIVARLIKARMGTKIFMVEIGGFDTHANQLDDHLQLLNNIATAVKAFYDDLKADNSGLENSVLSMTFSEFGRTIYENGSLGTDHGWGTHYLMFGGGLGSGVIGSQQDLSNPDPFTDPEFGIDFRNIYSSLMANWLGNSPDLVNYVMGQPFDPISGLVPAIAPAVGINGECALVGHNPDPSNPAAILIKYAMMRPGNVRLEILDKAGHSLRVLVNEFQREGSYNFQFKPADWFVAAGEYQYRLMTGGQVFQRRLRVG